MRFHQGNKKPISSATVTNGGMSFRSGDSGALSRVHLASLFTESCSVPSHHNCTIPMYCPSVPVCHLCVPCPDTIHVYLSAHLCKSQCTIPTYLSTLRYTIPVVRPSCVLPLCTTPACMCTICMYQCHISVYHLTAQSQCIYVPSQYTSIHSQYSIPVYLPSISAYPCAILVYHHSIPVFYPNTPVYHLQQGSIKPRPTLILLDVLHGWFISNV